MLVKELTGREKAILAWKGGEYTEGADRLQNFRQVAGFMGCTPAGVALAYLLKHIQSITIGVLSEERPVRNWAWETDGGEGLKQRFADARNYLLLLAACLDEEQDESSD